MKIDRLNTQDRNHISPREVTAHYLVAWKEHGSGMWALVDQAIVSLGSFLTTISLARGLEPAKYGTFVLILVTLFLLNSIQTSLIGYPLIVRGAVAKPYDFRELASNALLLSLCIAIPLSLILGIVVFVVSSDVLLGIVSAMASLFWQLQCAFRNAFIARSQYREAIAGDTISFGLQALVIVVIVEITVVSLDAIILIIAATSCLGLFVQAYQLRLPLMDIDNLMGHAQEFWRLGRWTFLTAIVSAIIAQTFLLILATTHGSGAVAEYQAVANLLGVTHPVMLTLGNLLVPAIALAAQHGSVADARHACFRRAWPIALLLAPFFLVLFAASSVILSIAYGSDSAYTGLVAQLRWMVIAYVFFFIATILASILNGMEHAQHTLISQIISAIAGVCIGVPLCYVFGSMGATIGVAIAFLTIVLANAYQISRIGSIRNSVSIN